MELSKKTTILLSPRLHKLLRDRARARGTSIGDLVREACENQYGLSPQPEAIEAVRGLESLALPVGSPAELKRQSVPDAEELLR